MLKSVPEEVDVMNDPEVPAVIFFIFEHVLIENEAS